MFLADIVFMEQICHVIESNPQQKWSFQYKTFSLLIEKKISCKHKVLDIYQ